MNYRHSFHAGNFADLVKHALLLRLLALRQADGPVAVIDTHAGAGVYDLNGDAARSGEARAGVERLMAAGSDLPPALAELAKAVGDVYPDRPAGAALRLYPGSPRLVADRLRPGDRYVGHELNPPVYDLLVQALDGRRGAVARLGDGFEAVEAGCPAAAVVLIDPPFERADDYARAARAAAVVAGRDPTACVAVWTPIKDMETFDRFLRALARGGAARVLVAEARLRPLSDPMRMNGCAMVFVNPPAGLEATAREVCGWVAATLGGAGAKAEVWTT